MANQTVRSGEAVIERPRDQRPLQGQAVTEVVIEGWSHHCQCRRQRPDGEETLWLQPERVGMAHRDNAAEGCFRFLTSNPVFKQERPPLGSLSTLRVRL